MGGGGGTEKTLYAILNALENTSHIVTLYTFSKPKIRSKKIKIKTILPISIPSFGLYQRAMESRLAEKAKHEDILIQASGGICIPSSQKQKIIVYCHNNFSSDLDKPLTKYKGLWSLYYKSYYSLVKKFLNNLSNSNVLLISNSNYVHNSIKTKYGKESSIIYPPVSIDEFTPTQKQLQFVSLGRFSEEKNLEFGIDVASKLNFSYNIIGNTKTKSNIVYYEKLLSKIKKLNSESKIQIFKNIKRNVLVTHLNTSKVYFHCSDETFGISVIEAIAAGCIPIVPNNSANKETVPFEELRYRENDLEDARTKIKKALDGEFDHLQKPLCDSIQKFSQQNFQQSFLRFIEEST